MITNVKIEIETFANTDAEEIMTKLFSTYSDRKIDDYNLVRNEKGYNVITFSKKLGIDEVLQLIGWATED